MIFNKTDLPDEGNVQGLANMYKELGYSVHLVSATSGEGIAELREALADRTVVFAGNTGVGKSSLLNALYPELSLETGEISEKLGRGRHTTRHIELYSANGGLIADTPGFGALELEGYTIERSSLQNYFPEFSAFTNECSFKNCAHIDETICGVRSALAEGKIDSERYSSYCQVYQYLKEEETPWNKKTNN